jgi:hypothetical protein
MSENSKKPSMKHVFRHHALVDIFKLVSFIFTEGSKTKCFNRQKHLVFVLFNYMKRYISSLIAIAMVIILSACAVK